VAGLSRRGQTLIDRPPLAIYIREHFSRAADERYVGLCIAENRRMTARLLECIDRYRDVPAHAVGYDAMIGNADFRTNLAAFMSRSFLGRTVTAAHVAVLAGAGSVLEQLFYTIADPGDAVLVPTPSYAGFWADLETRDELHVVPVPARSDHDFRLTVDDFDAALERASRPVRALLFTSPDNPLGRVYSRETLVALLQWAQRRSIHVVFDEIYALSVFGDTPFVSAASLQPSLGPTTHIVWAFSKDFGASGLRCGVLVSENEDVLAAVDQLAYWSACSGHTQFLLSQLVADTEAVDAYVAATRGDLRQTYVRVSAALDAAGIPYVPAEAGFFLVCDLRRHLDEPSVAAEQRLWRRLLDEANVNLTPGEACRIAEPGFFRLCYAGTDLPAVEDAILRVGRCLD
jgi:aspartate/methionine/tyrosine aminotransferase